VRVAVSGFGSGVLALHSGVVIAEVWRPGFPSGDSVFVARPRRPVVEYQPKRRCWLRLARGAFGMSFPGLGKPFVTEGLAHVGAPRRVPGGWELPVTLSETSSFHDVKLMITTSYLFRSVAGRSPSGKRLIERVRALTTQARIPTTRPL